MTIEDPGYSIATDGVFTVDSASSLEGMILPGPGTTSAQTYGGAVTLVGDTTLGNASGGSVTFDSTVNGGHGLTVGEAATYDGAVGGSTALSQVTDINGTTLGASVTTSGRQTYSGAVSLGANTTLTST
ncbi:MAG: hypothetical protein ACRDRL_13355, partial [Sciscionella sp.]